MTTRRKERGTEVAVGGGATGENLLVRDVHHLRMTLRLNYPSTKQSKGIVYDGEAGPGLGHHRDPVPARIHLGLIRGLALSLPQAHTAVQSPGLL